ncbi:hypothetical protein Daus18300_012259, partial [Diaporthe australafricana]
MAQAQIQGGQFTTLTWSGYDRPRPGDDLMGWADKGLLLSRPFESDGLVSIRIYVDLGDEARVMFAYLDNVLWLSPPAPGLTVKPIVAGDESVMSTGNFRQIRQWLSHCNQNHPRCGLNPARSGPVFLPSRLIDVGGSEESCVRLISSTDSMRGDNLYTTLSYCWGGAQRLNLSSSNVTDFEKGFPLSSLPKTIREAIQDSVEDWEAEAVRMSDVYGSSYCTIMATHGRDSDEGIFRPRVDNVVRPTWHKVWYEDQARPTVFMREMPIEAEGELMWECQSTVTCESFPDGFGGNGVINNSYLWILKLKPTGHMTVALKRISAMLTWAT